MLWQIFSYVLYHPYIRMGDWKYVWRTVGFDGWEQAPREDGDVQRTDPRFETRDGGQLEEDPVVEIRDVRHKLFNLADDPEERVDLAGEEPERAAVMLARLGQHLETVLDVTLPDLDEAGDPSNFGGVWTSGWC